MIKEALSSYFCYVYPPFLQSISLTPPIRIHLYFHVPFFRQTILTILIPLTPNNILIYKDNYFFACWMRVPNIVGFSYFKLVSCWINKKFLARHEQSWGIGQNYIRKALKCLSWTASSAKDSPQHWELAKCVDGTCSLY